jgi:LEA14-like dessication related protein
VDRHRVCYDRTEADGEAIVSGRTGWWHGAGRRGGGVAAALGTLGLLAACSWFAPKFETPHLSIVGIDVLKSDLLEQRLNVRVRVQNPNARTLPVQGLSYDIELAGKDLAHGVSTNAFTVPAFGDAEFDMRVDANMVGALAVLLGRRSGANGDAVPYRISGKVALSSGFLRNVPFEEKGSIRLR